MCWTGEIALEEALAAADRLRRTRTGRDVPAWGEPERPAKGASPRLANSRPAADQPAGDPDPQAPPDISQAAGRHTAQDSPSQGPAADASRSHNLPTGDRPTGDLPTQDPPDEDPLGEDPLAEDELRAAETDGCEPMSTSEMAGHVRMLPGPDLAAWLGQARPGQLDEAGLVNSITGWRKLTSWAQAQELAAVAELGRRRGVMDDPELDRDPARELSAEFASNEVALALTLTQYAAEWWMSLAVNMSRRLPATWSALSEGTIDLGRAKLIDLWTTPLDDDLARAVERKVLGRAGQQTTGQLRASLQRAVISVDPTAAERRRTEAEKNARVELAGEDSGTAALSGHFLPAAQASAAWARISGLAEAMKGDGAGGGVDLLRAQVFIGLLLGTLPQPPGQADPGNSDPPGTSPDGGDSSPGGGDTDAPGNPDPYGASPDGDSTLPSGGSPSPGEGGVDAENGDHGPSPHPTAANDQPWCWPPIPALGEVLRPVASTGTVKIRRPELNVSWRTLAGWWDEPGQLTRMGAITAAVARELARAAAADPTCQWRVVVTDAEGQVIAVTKVRWPGRPHRKTSQPPGADTPRGPDPDGPGVLGRITVTVPVMLLGEPPPGVKAGANTDPGLVAALRGILTAAAAREVGGHPDGAHLDGAHPDGGQGVECTHANAVPGYRIPDWMRDLIEVRDQDCGFPICRRPASRCDLDHTVPYDQGGLTCPCNISGGCRHDHRMKGSTAWRLEQPRPGTLIWTAPSGLSWTVTPQPHIA
jgi:Domain of unknown function (DUF222)